MRIGEYEIKERFKSLEIGERYFRMNERQKESVKKNFFNCSLTDKKFENTFDEHVSLPTEEALLSVQIKDFKIGTVPFLVLNDMYQDAANLVRGENTVVKSPSFEPGGKNEVWMVASRRAPGKPHNVTASKTGRVVCDKGCVGWAQYSICCHTLAVAENLGILRKFLEWLQKNKKTKKQAPLQKWQMSVCRKRVDRKLKRPKSVRGMQNVFQTSRLPFLV
jgi:hypothetical protein